MTMDSHLRSILKAISWRIIAIIVLTTIVWIVTGDPTISITIGVIDVTIKIVLYYLHERIWLKVNLDSVKDFLSWFERED